jgi:hypothetical protein
VRKPWTRPSLILLAVVLGTTALAASHARAATVIVINNDGPGEGFNDSTPKAPVGGNTGTTVGAQRLIAFQRAADIWGGFLVSAVTIRISATFDVMSCDATSAVLGSAGPAAAFRNFTGAPLTATWYHVALANALHGSDLDPDDPDITAQFNSTIGTTCAFPKSWYYGLDGNAGADIDFVTVVLHELGHGLGFSTFVNLTTGAKAGGFNDAFMRNLEHHGASPADYASMTDAQRVAANTSTGNLHWVGANVRAASGVLTAGKVGDHVRMFAPNPQQAGASVAHWDTALSPSQLLEPSYTGPLDPELELALFQDLGWTLLSPVSNLALNKVATQSSTPPWGGAASRAVDGNTDGDWTHSSVTHTNLDAQAWWQVDLGSLQAVQSVEVWNRTDCCGERLSNFNVLLLDASQAVVAGMHVAGQAGAPTVVPISGMARYVRVQLVGTNYLSLAEVKVWGTPAGLSNLALNKAAAQSSTPPWGGAASRAVDGNTDGDWTHSSVTHTNLDAQAWWQVDLGSMQAVQSVEVWNRTDCCGERLSNFNVLLLDASQAVIASMHVAGQAGAPTAVPISGTARYVRVQLVGTNYLSLAEVKVWGFSNLAVNKAATQSSTPPWGGPASRAVDGNTDGEWTHNSVTHTNLDAQAWWQVDLGSMRVVQSVDVWNRTDCCGERLSNFNVLLLDASQAVVATMHVGGQAGAPTAVPISGTARYVRVQLVGTNYLSLAEVKVWGSGN